MLTILSRRTMPAAEPLELVCVCVWCVCVVCAHEQIIVDGEEHLVPHRGMPVPQDDGRLLYGDMRVRVRLRTLHRYVVVYTKQCRFITTEQHARDHKHM